MKVHEAFALALGIAAPLWLRQRRIEQALVATQQQFQKQVVEALDQSLKSYERWADSLQKEIQRAFREAR